MGRTGHPALILGTTALLVVAVGSGVALTRGAGPVAKAATTLSSVVDTTIVSPTGVTTVARDGQRVANGDVVVTGSAGSAALATRGRVVYLESAAADAVLDGAHQQLRTGRAVIDAQHGPGLTVDLASDVLIVPGKSATEASRSVITTVGALAGSAHLTSSAGRSLTVNALSQAVVSGDALPASTSPLRLQDSAAEARVVPTLVDDDVALKQLAVGINTTGAATARVVEASWTAPTVALPATAARSERVLPMLIADATATSGGTAETRYEKVLGWRAAGGSWGVVDELLDGHANSVESAFAALQRRSSAGHIGAVSIPTLAAPSTGASHRRHHGGATSPGQTGRTNPSDPNGSNSGSPTPTPTSSTGLVGGLVGTLGSTVSGVLGTVLGLLPSQAPTKSATPTTSSTPGATHPSPHPTKSSGGLLGGLLGN